MRLILKRHVTRDPAGRPLAVRYERVTDDEAGRVQSSEERTARACTGCGRFLTEVEQRRGVCQACLRRECCDHCTGRCDVCRRQLCGECRRGFAGPPPMTVCVPCGVELLNRQRREDERQRSATAFERLAVQHRLLNQIEAQRESVRHKDIALQLQAARLGLRFAKPKTRWQRLLGALKRLAGWMVRRVFG